MGIALTGATIYPSPSDARIDDGVVAIEGDAISAIGKRGEVAVPHDAHVLDCSGLTVTAGFWNSHVHFFERKWTNAAAIPADELTQQLEDFTRYGFTSVFDLSSLWENTQQIRARIESGEVRGPHIRTTGEGLIPPDALPPDVVLAVLGAVKTPLPEVTDPGSAMTATSKLLERGADGIKMFVSSQRSDPLAESTMRAAVDRAHRDGKPVFVHPSSAADIASAVRAGVDVIAHTTPGSGPWDDELLRAMREAGVALTPTLTLWKHAMRHDRLSMQKTYVTTAVDQLRAWRRHGGEVLFGTDYGAVDADPREEYVHMALAGMTFAEILASLTTAPAERFGAHRLGRLAPGFQADLAVIDGDPTEDVLALRRIRYTIRAGKLVYRASEGGLAV